MTAQRVGWVDPRTGVVHVDDSPAPMVDPLARALALITDIHHSMRYLTAPRWKRPLLRLFRRRL